jgi:hypothetical protein
MTTPLQNLAAARGQDDDLRWVFLYNPKDKSLLGGIGVLTYGGGASVSHFHADTPALASLLLDFASSDSGYTLGGITPLKPGAFKAKHGANIKELLTPSAGARLPLNRWKQFVEEATEHDEDADADY